MYDRKYLIIPTSELKKVDFSQIIETSPDHLLYSSDGKKTFIKWNGDDPDFITELKNVSGPYNNEEMREILKNKRWEIPSNVI